METNNNYSSSSWKDRALHVYKCKLQLQLYICWKTLACACNLLGKNTNTTIKNTKVLPDSIKELLFEVISQKTNALKPKIFSIIFKHSVRTPNTTRHFFSTHINRLMLFREISLSFREPSETYKYTGQSY